MRKYAELNIRYLYNEEQLILKQFESKTAYPKSPESQMIIANLFIINRMDKFQDGFCSRVSIQIDCFHTF